MLEQYLSSSYDEAFDIRGDVRMWYQRILQKISSMGIEDLQQRQAAAERAFLTMGITFNVYGHKDADEKIFPFDVIPRIIPADEWETVEQGLRQRVIALNHFIDDIYHKQNIILDGIIPKEVIFSSAGYLPACQGLQPPRRIWTHISGIDLIRHADGDYYILEDNLRVPSGVSYVLGNREIMKRTFPHVFEKLGVVPINDYPQKLLETLQYLSAEDQPTVVVLTPGAYNSAYFEHSFLAQQMGVQLVEGRDLMVVDDCVYMRTTKGAQRVHVIYRRIDDDFLDPQVFRPDSVLGVPGLFDAYRKGNVAIANAPGTGVADDKVVCSYVPDMIKYYMGEEPILANVQTYLCWRDDHRDHVLTHLSEMVVKESNQSGGYGMLMGPTASQEELNDFKEKIKAAPRHYIAQPVMDLSTVPTFISNDIVPRHVDLRPFILFSDDVYVLNGGLTRVALKEGSLVVNSSQGGGSKDTWVMRGDIEHA